MKIFYYIQFVTIYFILTNHWIIISNYVSIPTVRYRMLFYSGQLAVIVSYQGTMNLQARAL